MVTHEIVAIRKGSSPERKSIELNVVKRTPVAVRGEKKRFEGIEINASVHIEAEAEQLVDMFGQYDVGTKVTLDEIKFSQVAEDVEGD